jgi:hypothetical protein
MGLQRSGVEDPTHVSNRRHRRVPHSDWAEKIPDDEWKIYHAAIEVMRSTGRPFMLAGAFSLASYTGLWRNTKDLDFYVLPQDREPMIAALTHAGFVDYFHQLPYVRHWIYRAWKKECIVDIIWAMANQRAQVDENWFTYAPEVTVRGQPLLVVPAEELLWCKLYVLQKDRCDWGDVMNLVHSMGHELDWRHLIERMRDDLPLLIGLLNVYCWACPGAELHLPEQLRAVLPHCANATNGGPVYDKSHLDLLDSRPWFIAAQQHS